MTRLASMLHGRRVEYETYNNTLYLLSDCIALQMPDHPLPKALQKVAVPAQNSSPAMRLTQLSKGLSDIAVDTGLSFKPSASRPALRILTATKASTEEQYAVYVDQHWFSLVEDDIISIITGSNIGTVEIVTAYGLIYIQPHLLQKSEADSLRTIMCEYLNIKENNIYAGK